MGSDARQLITVLRKKIGDKFFATDGQGRVLTLEIKNIENDMLRCRIVSASNANEYSLDLTVFQAIPRGQTIELIIEKLCELGVNRIVPILTERTVPRYDQEKAKKKQQRWQRIADETMKKVGRSIGIGVSAPVSFKQIEKQLATDSLKIIPWELEQQLTLKQLLKTQNSVKSVSVIIGPEGGFSKSEVDFCVSTGFKPVSLGPRILKVETAAIVTAANIFYELG